MNVADQRKAYAVSPLHLLLLGGTIWVLLQQIHYVPKIIAAAVYGAGWELIPGTAWFKRWMMRSPKKAPRVAKEVRATFKLLSEQGQTRYLALREMAEEVESEVVEIYEGKDDHQASVIRRQLDRMKEAHLKLLLMIEQMGAVLGETVTDEAVETLTQEIGDLEATGQRDTAKLLASKQEHLALMQQRKTRQETMSAERVLAESEVARIEELMRVLRADLFPTKNLDEFSLHIDVCQEQLSRVQMDFLEEYSGVEDVS